MNINTKKNVISITFLTLLIMSLCSPIHPVISEDNGLEGGDDAPTVLNVIDYDNGTTRMIMEHADGSRETFTQTLLVQTLVEVPGETPEIVSKPLPDAPSIMGLASVGPEEVIDLYTQKEVVMGFTHHLLYEKSDGDTEYLIYKWESYVGVTFDLGLRYPVRITLQYPNVMTEEIDHVFNAKLTPLDWSGFDELLLQAHVSGYFHDWWWVFVEWVQDNDYHYSETYDYSLSYPTPVGSDMTIPFVPPIGDTFFESEWFDLAYEIFPQIGSDKVTTQVTATGDATGNQIIQFEEPEEWVPFTIHADDYGPTDYAQISLSEFRYYFSLFNLQILLHIDFHGIWETWFGDPSIEVFMWDWSEYTEDIYLPVHEGTEGTMSTPWIFVQYFGMDLSVSPGTVSIEPGNWGEYTVTVTNTGNVHDEFDTFYVDQPSNWDYQFSPGSVSMDPGASESLQVSIMPYRHCSVAPGDYTVTVGGRSEGAAEWGLVRGDSDNTIVHVLPFYEVDLWIDPVVSTVKPRETASYTLNVHNKGNVPDSFDFTTEYYDFGAYRAYPTVIQPEWVDIEPDPIGPIDPCHTDAAELTILVPGEWAGMEDSTYDFDVTATSLEDLTHIPPASDTDSDELTVEATKESMVRYIKLEVEWLTEDVTSWPGKEDIKESLLDKLTAAMEKYEQTLDNILRGRNKQANNMLKAWKNVMSAFINLIEAQDGKNIGEVTAEDWIGQAETIISDIETAMATPID